MTQITNEGKFRPRVEFQGDGYGGEPVSYLNKESDAESDEDDESIDPRTVVQPEPMEFKPPPDRMRFVYFENDLEDVENGSKDVGGGSKDVEDNSKNVENSSKNVENDSENIENDSQNVENDSENVGNNPTNVGKDSEDVKDDSENIGGDSENVGDNLEDVGGDLQNVGSDSENDIDCKWPFQPLSQFYFHLNLLVPVIFPLSGPDPLQPTIKSKWTSVDLRRNHGKLQIIVKLANIHLTPENPSYDGGTWHVEGQWNENM